MTNVETVAAGIVALLSAAKDDAERTAIVAKVCRGIYAAGRADAAGIVSAPVRIQLRRTKGWRIPKNTVVVSRPSKWGNPFVLTDPVLPGARRRIVDQFRDALQHERLSFTAREAEDALRGKNLACWCPIGQPCHADVLLAVANAEVTP